METIWKRPSRGFFPGGCILPSNRRPALLSRTREHAWLASSSAAPFSPLFRRGTHRLYALHEEIGRGAFSVVHRCTNRVTGEDFAVKLMDLRPLQLRENFDQARLRREVEIMQRLEHPHIIRLEGVFEDASTLVLVLEYARGTELFDSILQKKRYTEEEARPIFVQVAHALAYLHRLHIVHRDVKPENVILLDALSPEGFYPFAKLLDFGLSKMIGQDDGSAARTFVGTPCYLAPEVEARAYGRGGGYGTKVDCWSLGAVLYVMLVARFPEFDRSQGGMAVKLEAPAWGGVSAAAKDLLRCLMQVDPGLRFTVEEALQHPWVTGRAFQGPCLQLGRGGAGGIRLPLPPPRPPSPPSPPSPSSTASSMAVARAGSGAGDERPPPGSNRSAAPSSSGSSLPPRPRLPPSGPLSPDPGPPPASRPPSSQPDPSEPPPQQQQLSRFSMTSNGEPFKLLPLLTIQHTIAHSIELAHRACEHSPQDAHDVKRSAILCRAQLIYTIKLLKKIEQTGRWEGGGGQRGRENREN